MNVTLAIPRSRPGHIASFTGPEGCNSVLLKLTDENGDTHIAERDPSSAIYHVRLPAASIGEALKCSMEAIDEAPPCDGIDLDRHEGSFDVSLAGAQFLTFHYGGDAVKPVINPIMTPGGTNMLREMMGAYTEGEHPWQRGLTLMQGAINEVDCWNEADKKGFGRTEQDAIAIHHRPLSLVWETENTWYELDKPLMTDSRSYRVFDTARDAVILDIALTLKASHGAITIGPTKEAGFVCIRVNPTMNASADGRMVNSYGAADEAGCWSKRAHWMDYFGPVGNETVGFAVFDHPENLRYPTAWHVRGYGLFAPNCWMNQPDHTIPDGETLTFRWRVVVHSGDTHSAQIRERYLDYVDGPRATWE